MTTATIDPLVDAVLALAARDTDHATEQNGVGYNGTDTGFGNRLAATPVEHWSAGNRREAYETRAHRPRVRTRQEQRRLRPLLTDARWRVADTSVHDRWRAFHYRTTLTRRHTVQ